MALPINIQDLINGQVVEWDRIEFKKGWNPEDVIHTMCAFANDINNWGGGYLIVGIDEYKGHPILPPEGLELNQLDAIQGRLLELCYNIQPNYFPISQPVEFHGKHVFIIWIPAGDNRPYSAPVSLGGRSDRAFYVRRGSRTIKAGGETLRQLQELTARIPFDDRVNQQTTLDDLSLSHIQAFLKEVKSNLFEDSSKISFKKLCSQMAIIRGPKEHFFPVNVGLLFFNENPDHFFDRARIEIVLHKDDSGRNFIEKVFNGPVHNQLRNALNFIKTMVIQEKVNKVKDKAEALRFYNYPYEAIEEVIANAVFHKGYDLSNPIEIQIFPDRIEVLSFPGPMPPIDEKMLKKRRIAARQYRNRRIGDFLKELHLTEGRGSGFPLIYRTLENNGSPPPEFTTDQDKTYFLSVIKSHPEFKNVIASDRADDRADIPDNLQKINSIDDVKALIDYYINEVSDRANDKDNDKANDQDSDRDSDRDNDRDNDSVRDDFIKVSNKVNDIVSNVVGDKVYKTLNYCIIPKTRENLLSNIKLKYHSDNYNRYVKPLIELEWLEMTEADITSKNQKYRTTERGKILLQIISNSKDAGK